MRYLALACDYDGTLAWDGQIAATTVAALLALRDSAARPCSSPAASSPT